MPARSVPHWIIVVGAELTSFRARKREDLVPTLRQLQRTQPKAALMWFERGRFWESPKHADEARAIRERISRSRPREWRPGGTHQDPRARFELTRDQKRAKFKRNLGRGPRVPKKSG